MGSLIKLATWALIESGRVGSARTATARMTAAASPVFLLSEATRLFSEHKGAVLLAALVAGMAVANGGRKP
jgi:hypothetical protein